MMIVLAGFVGQWVSWVIYYWEAMFGGLFIAVAAYLFFRRNSDGDINQIIAPVAVTLTAAPLIVFGMEGIYNAIAASQLETRDDNLEEIHRIASEYSMQWGLVVPAAALALLAILGWALRKSKTFYLFLPAVSLLFSIYFTLAGEITLEHSKKAYSGLGAQVERRWSQDEISAFHISCEERFPEEFRQEGKKYCACMLENTMTDWSYVELVENELEIRSVLGRRGVAADCVQVSGLEGKLLGLSTK